MFAAYYLEIKFQTFIQCFFLSSRIYTLEFIKKYILFYFLSTKEKLSQKSKFYYSCYLSAFTAVTEI